MTGQDSPDPPDLPEGPYALAEGLVADIVAMTCQAAIDGLPLSAVLDDLRLVLELEPDAPLPVFALRACALEWGRASQALDRAPAAEALTLDDLEGRLWASLDRAPDQLPAYAVVVRVSQDAHDAGSAPQVPVPGVLHDADLLAAAGQVVESVFDHPHEDVVVLREGPAGPPDRVVVLVPRGAEAGTGDVEADEAGAGLADRVALLRASLGSSAVTGRRPWSVQVVRLADDPGGVLAGLRAALGPA